MKKSLNRITIEIDGIVLALPDGAKFTSEELLEHLKKAAEYQCKLEYDNKIRVTINSLKIT